jgi:hypothetical protein
LSNLNIQLKYCRIEADDQMALVRFPDGTSVGSTPHDTHSYHVISHRLGYEDDILAYCREHEFAHAFMEEKLHDRPSQVLWNLAHNLPIDDKLHAYEEIAAQTFQKWLRSAERPITSGVDWIQMKKEALQLLEGR